MLRSLQQLYTGDPFFGLQQKNKYTSVLPSFELTDAFWCLGLEETGGLTPTWTLQGHLWHPSATDILLSLRLYRCVLPRDVCELSGTGSDTPAPSLDLLPLLVPTQRAWEEMRAAVYQLLAGCLCLLHTAAEVMKRALSSVIYSNFNHCSAKDSALCVITDVSYTCKYSYYFMVLKRCLIPCRSFIAWFCTFALLFFIIQCRCTTPCILINFLLFCSVLQKLQTNPVLSASLWLLHEFLYRVCQRHCL